MKKKTIALVLACILCVGIGIGGTLAWLTATSDDVVNTFTTSDIDITLDETKGGTDREFKMVPGYTIEKDPIVTVTGGSEACYLFVKITEGNALANYITYEVDSGWTQGDGTAIPANVYYRQVAASDTDSVFHILKNDQVSVKETVTKANMATAETTQPTLTFTAYATQLYKNNNETDNTFTAAEAWVKAQSST